MKIFKVLLITGGMISLSLGSPIAYAGKTKKKPLPPTLVKFTKDLEPYLVKAELDNELFERFANYCWKENPKCSSKLSKYTGVHSDLLIQDPKSVVAAAVIAVDYTNPQEFIHRCYKQMFEGQEAPCLTPKQISEEIIRLRFQSFADQDNDGQFGAP